MALSDRDGVREASVRASTKRQRKREVQLAKTVRRIGAGTVAPAARTVKREVPKVVAREVARQPKRPAKTPKRVDPAYAKALREVEAYEKSKKERPKGPEVQTGGVSGLSPLLSAANLENDGKSLGGFLTNLGAGAVRTITDLPAGAQLAGEAALLPFVKATNLVQGGGGRGQRASFGSGVERQIESDLSAAGRGIKDDYAYRYGPLVRGDVKEFGSRFYDDPLPTILDVGGAYSVAGRAPAAAARAGAAITTGRTSERLARAGSRSRVAPGERDLRTGEVSETGGRLYRQPRRFVGTATGETPKGTVNTGSRVIETPRRPYSPNVITRAGQRGADRVRTRITPRVERYAEARQPRPGDQGSTRAAILRPLTQQGKFDRAQEQATRDLIFRREQQAAGAAGRDSARFVKAVRDLKPDKNSAGVRQKGLGTEAIAARLHLEDVLSPRGGQSPAQLRDLVVERMEQGIAKAEARGDRVDLTRRQVEQIKAIPAELLDLTDMNNPAVVRVARAVTEGRALDKISQGRSVRAGAVSAETAADMRGRTSALLLGGSDWAPAVMKEMKKAGASKEARQKVRASAVRETPALAKKREQLAEADAKLASERSKIATRTTLNKVFSAGRITGRGERNVELAPKQRMGNRRRPGQPTRNQDYLLKTRGGGRAEYEAKKFSAKLSGGRRDPLVPHPPVAPGETRPKGISSGQGKAYRTVLRGRAKQYEVRLKTQGGSARKVEAARKKRDAYFRQVKKMEEQALGFTPPTRPDLVGDKGVYIPKKPVDKISEGGAFPKRRGFSGPTKSKRDKGYNVQKGGFDMNPELLAHQAKRATDAEIGPMSNAALDELIGIAAYLDDAGKMVSGKRAVQMARTDPDRVVLVHRGRLREALSKLDSLEEGKTLAPGEVKMFYGESKESWLQAIPDGPDTGQYVAISKAAADVWREAPTTSTILKASDRLMDYFKGGILALSPRWYVNSTIGIGTQYGLMAGLDIRSLRQGIRKGPIKEAVPDEVVLNNLANDVGFKGEVDANKLQRAFELGFRANNRMESAWRRAAYINRGKKAIRDEGGRIRGLTDEEIARAIDSMPPSIATNVIRDVDLFMGEFRKFNAFERNVMKRVIPFYSFLRVVSRLTFTLPFRSPVRVAALNLLGRAGEMGINPEDYARPVYERGALRLGKYRVPTMGFNTPGALVGAIQAGTKIANDPSSALGQLGEEAVSWARPEIQTGLAATYGTTNFGNPVIAPTGYSGTVSGFGGREAIDPSTGLVGSSRVRIPIDEALLQSFGGAPAQFLRRAVSGGERPFDTTRTLDLLNARLTGGSTEGKFLDPAARPYKRQVGMGLGSAAGINPHTEDLAELLRRYEKAQRDYKRKKKRQDRKK